MKKRLGLIAVVLVGSLGMAAPALAQYGGDDQALSVSDTTPTPGQSLQVEGCCFASNSAVDIVIRSTPQQLGQFQADDGGRVSATVVIPSDIESGPHTLTLSGVAPDGSEMTLVRELVVPGAARDQLAISGATLGTMMGAGFVLIGSGLILTRARRRTA